MCGEMQTMPFGAVGGVLAWWRCAMAQRAIMRRLFEAIIFYYVDDTHVIDVEPGSGEAVAAFQEVMSLLGWALDTKKRQPSSSCVQSLGCQLSVHSNGVSWALDSEKRETWLGDIRRHLASGVMQPGEAAKLYGRLAFGGQRVFGRVGRAALRPLARQQRGRSTHIARRLSSALTWWEAFLSQCPVQHLKWERRLLGAPDMVLYTDAEQKGRVGVALIDNACGRGWYVASRVPRRWRRALIPRKTQINLYELLAVTLAVRTFANELRGKRIVAFIDNTCALNMVIRGASRKDDANGILHHLWLELAMLGVHAEWQYVPSKLNIADGPSRECFTDVLALGLSWRMAQWGTRLL